MIRCQNFIVTVNVHSVHCQLQHISRLMWEVFRSFVDQFLWHVALEDTRSIFLSVAIVFCFILSLL